MIFVNGEILPREEGKRVLDELPSRIAATLAAEPLQPEQVIAACDALSQSLGEEHALLLQQTGMDRHVALGYMQEARAMLAADYLRHKLDTELGHWRDRSYCPPEHSLVHEKLLPLGVLFHIVAGNVDALPAYSIIEGLLAGNINLAKLPGGDNGLSILLLDELVKQQPKLADYIYVFDYSSDDVDELAQLAEQADAVVVWGGDRAVAATRSMAKPNTQIIEWGHKLSFAYAVPGSMGEGEFRELAASMVSSRQLLCSSCQGLYVDTEDMRVVYEHAESMLRALDECSEGRAQDLGVQAQVGLAAYTEQLESVYKGHRVFRGKRSNVIACEDSVLEPAIQHGNCWVKPLSRQNIIGVLKPHKNHLQTAALLCREEEREQLRSMLWRAGVVRVCGPGNMSYAYCGMPHDGECPLRRYTRVVCDDAQ